METVTCVHSPRIGKKPPVSMQILEKMHGSSRNLLKKIEVYAVAKA
jgi:hypothetical protein